MGAHMYVESTMMTVPQTRQKTPVILSLSSTAVSAVFLLPINEMHL